MDDAVGITRIPMVRQLLERGHEFWLSQAVMLLERSGLRPAGDERDGDGYVIRPAPEMSFPAGEIRRCYLDQRGRLVLEANHHALYGIDSPLPHYWLERASADEHASERLRAFLAWINARVYAALIAGWRTVHGRADEAAWADALGSLSVSWRPADSRERRGVAGAMDIFHRRRPTAEGARALIQRVTGHVDVRVEDRHPVRLTPSAPGQALGSPEGPTLGDDLCLGESLAVGTGRLYAAVGPTTELEAVRLGPGSERGRALRRGLAAYLGPHHRVEIDVHVRRGSRRPWRLGSDDRALGISAWLGDRAHQEQSVRITHMGGAVPGTENGDLKEAS